MLLKRFSKTFSLTPWTLLILFPPLDSFSLSSMLILRPASCSYSCAAFLFRSVKVWALCCDWRAVITLEVLFTKVILQIYIKMMMKKKTMPVRMTKRNDYSTIQIENWNSKFSKIDKALLGLKALPLFWLKSLWQWKSTAKCYLLNKRCVYARLVFKRKTDISTKLPQGCLRPPKFLKSKLWPLILWRPTCKIGRSVESIVHMHF